MSLRRRSSSSSCRECECLSFYKTACVALACISLTLSQFRHHQAVPNNVWNDPASKASHTIDSTKATIGEDIEQPADFEGAPSSLPRQSPPVEDHFRQAASEEPEMLLQPDTKPISHEQLVIEVKGIYAGLDIDERQLAAAHEKDPQKKTQLKNDQWQSLIALHKQVPPLGNILRPRIEDQKLIVSSISCSMSTMTPS